MTTTAPPVARYLFRCTAKHTWVRDYDRAKMAETRVYPWAYSERTCPTCGDLSFLPQPIRVTASDTPCGPACQEATGLDCRCSCQGANHSSALLRKVRGGQEILAARFVLPRPGLDTKSTEWGHLR